MRIYNISAYRNTQPTFNKSGIERIPEEIADLRVFHHHIYEFKKGIRNLILTTEKSKYENIIKTRLNNENIDYVINEIPGDKINVFFGAKLNELSAEQDFILGIMLGYDRIKQCERYMKIRNGDIHLGKKTS